MSSPLTEGQEFAANYSLLTRLRQTDDCESWIALDRDLNERVYLKVFMSPLSEQQQENIKFGVRSSRGLVHPHIARTYQLAEHDGRHFLTAQLIRAARPFNAHADSLADHWPLLEQLFDALSFAHQLGVAHGHLHPDNLLLDDRDQLYLVDFGMPSTLGDEEQYRQWLSPEVRRGETADLSDDIYSLGYLLHLVLTDEEWRGQVASGTKPIPAEVIQLMQRMLAESPYDRPLNLADIREVLRTNLIDGPGVLIDAHPTFSRSTGAQAEPLAHTGMTATLARDRRSISMSSAMLMLLLVIAGAFSLFWILPEFTASDSGDTPQTTTASPVTTRADLTAESQPPTVPVLTPLEAARAEQQEKDGKKIAADILRLQIELEDMGVKLWAADAWQLAQTKAEDGDQAFRDGEFDQALATYESARDALSAIKLSADQVKTDNLKLGQEYLQSGDFHNALISLSIVNAIDPGLPEGKAMLHRAENLEQVLLLIMAGESLEQDGQLDEAQQSFVDAVELDGQWLPASNALTRIGRKIALREFNDTMSSAFNALSDRQYEVAREAFLSAQKILPESSEPGDGMLQIEIAQRQEAIDLLLQAAAQQEDDEDWQAVAASFESVLELDPSIVIAKNGLENARRRIELDHALTAYISQPTSLVDDQVLKDARTWLVSAARINSPGDRLQEQTNRLSQYISLARIPVAVQVQSDNKTDVTVYRIGELGKLTSQSLELLPGKYTVVGKRRGYRDVRHQLVLLGGRPADPIYIACTEKI